MRVAVVGGGVIGLATAYSLVRQGHSVELIERRDDVGLETSFANGGQLSYRYVSPLADAGVPLQALGWMLRGQTAPLRFSPRASLRQWRWCLRFLAACTGLANTFEHLFDGNDHEHEHEHEHEPASLLASF